MISVRHYAATQAMRPFLVGHRGGVVTQEAPENSLRAIELAAQHAYAMVELDVMETADGEPVLMHGDLAVNCGVAERICRLTSKEITRLRYRASEQHVITLAEAVEACRTFGLGVMLDKLRNDGAQDGEMSQRCLARVVSLIAKAGLASSTVSIVDTPVLREQLSDIALFPVSHADVQRLAAGEDVPLQEGFWFGWAADLSTQVVAALHHRDVLAIVSINVFHYPPHAHYELARQDIARLLAAGVDGFQIDTVYEDCFRNK